jgi:hypothetical protein
MGVHAEIMSDGDFTDWVMHCVDAFSDGAVSNARYVPLRPKFSEVDRIMK